ncbi:MAG: carboxypeptidase-like regulatory domain-containing protein [Acidobacteriaceae bacterium]|nr:carboxypeptidase-like regulatory domain-containing protein [Acidobacteriaceae bacterium]
MSRILYAILFSSMAVAYGMAELPAAPVPQTATLNGTVLDVNGTPVAGASVVLDGPSPADRRTAAANADGFFLLGNLSPDTPYRATISQTDFSTWTSQTITLKPGQYFTLSGIQLRIAEVQTSVTATYSVEQIATQQVELAETQRVLGVIPNFYVVYDSANAVPLTAKLKFKLAYKSTFDPITLTGVALMAGINQAADRPDYVQGAKGYGQRIGSDAAIGFTNILIGGAILPSLLHQDPRYFYQGTGSKKSRTLHALSTPFICKGDNGHWQPNYSSIGGDLASGAISEAYYPETNRGPGLVFGNALINAGGRMVNGLIQEFVLRKLTSKSGKQQ